MVLLYITRLRQDLKIPQCVWHLNVTGLQNKHEFVTLDLAHFVTTVDPMWHLNLMFKITF